MFNCASYETTNVHGFGHPIYSNNMLNFFRCENEPIYSGNEGLKSLQLLNAVYQSSKSEKYLKLNL